MDLNFSNQPIPSPAEAAGIRPVRAEPEDRAGELLTGRQLLFLCLAYGWVLGSLGALETSKPGPLQPHPAPLVAAITVPSESAEPRATVAEEAPEPSPQEVAAHIEAEMAKLRALRAKARGSQPGAPVQPAVALTETAAPEATPPEPPPAKEAASPEPPPAEVEATPEPVAPAAPPATPEPVAPEPPPSVELYAFARAIPATRLALLEPEPPAPAAEPRASQIAPELPTGLAEGEEPPPAPIAAELEPIAPEPAPEPIAVAREPLVADRGAAVPLGLAAAPMPPMVHLQVVAYAEPKFPIKHPEDRGPALPTREPRDAARDELSRLAADIVLPPELYENAKVTIEDPNGAMRPFYEAMVRTAAKLPGAITRIGHWSDSSLGSDGASHSMRRRFQTVFGDAGHGFIAADPGTIWYKHKDVWHRFDKWKSVTRVVGDRSPDGRYGPVGSVSIGQNGSWVLYSTIRDRPVGTAVSKFIVHYIEGPQYGKLKIRLDGHEIDLLDTDAPVRGDAIYTVDAPDGSHSLKLVAEGGAQVRVYGVAMERAGPGVIYDSFGIVSARASRLLKMNKEHWAQQLAWRDHDLIIIQYGGNSLKDRFLDMERYGKTYRRVLRRFREARPNAACLVLSPTDHGKKKRDGTIGSDPLYLQMVPTQRQAALDEGCAWYSHFEAMGGEGSMGRWREKGWGWVDLRHLTLPGSKRVAGYFFRALMKGFNDYLEANRRARFADAIEQDATRAWAGAATCRADAPSCKPQQHL